MGSGSISQTSTALITISGGLDSYITLLFAIRSGFEVKTITFDYEQPSRKEIVLSEKIAARFKLDHKIIPIQGILPEGEFGMIPGRNGLFTHYASNLAYNMGCEYLILGLQKHHHRPFSDTTEKFVREYEKVISKYSGVKYLAKLYSPLIAMTKAQVIQLGTVLDPDFSESFKNTSSCYKPTVNDLDCGVCDGCSHRNLGFLTAGVVDPTIYAQKPNLNILR